MESLQNLSEEILDNETSNDVPDTSGADKLFIYSFINYEMMFDFWDITQDFLIHHYPRLKEFNDMAENYTDFPIKIPLEIALQKKILNIIYYAAKSGDEYCVALMRELYKTYYKKEYNQLKRFRKISISELKELAKDNDGDLNIFALSRILGMCVIYKIELPRNCFLLYHILNESRKRLDDNNEASCVQFDIDLELDCLKQIKNWLPIQGECDIEPLHMAEQFVELYLQHNAYGKDYIDMYSKYDNDILLFTDTMAVLKTAFPEKEFTFHEVQFFSVLSRSIHALINICDESNEVMSRMLGITPALRDKKNKCLFHPENIKLPNAKPEKSQKKKEPLDPVVTKPETPETETDYLQEINNLRIRLKEKEQECKYYRQQLEQTKSSLSEMEEIIKEHENDKEELISLRNYVYSLSSEELPVQNEETIADMKKKIAERKIIIIGGHTNWTNKMKKEFPNWRFLDANINRGDLSETFEGVEKVYFYTNHISHAIYKRFVAIVRENNISFGYLHTINIDSLVRQIYEELNPCKSEK